jgi:uncharacterized protein (TIGR02271 family)
MLTTEQIDRLLSQGANVLSGDGEKIGSIGQVFVDNEDGQPNWVTVRTGLFGISESFVPLQGARTEGNDIVVPYSKNQVKEAPRIDADQALEPAEEDRLYQHYRIESGRTYTEAATANADFTASPGSDRADARDTTGTAGYDTTAPATGDTLPATAQPDTTGADRTGTRNTTGTAEYDTTAPATGDTLPATAQPDTTGADRPAAGPGRLRKYVTTENVTRTVPVQREEIRIEREPITEESRSKASGRPGGDDDGAVILHEERLIVTKETVPVERVRIGTETVTDEVTINEDVRKEHLDTSGPEDSHG